MIDIQELYVGAIERSHRWMDHVIDNAAKGNWVQLLEDVGDDLNSVDAVDDDSIARWEVARRAAESANEAQAILRLIRVSEADCDCPRTHHFVPIHVQNCWKKRLGQWTEVAAPLPIKTEIEL